MIRKLLFILFTVSVLSVSAQTTETVTIDWSFGSNSNVTPATAANNADRTIEEGDTVIWNYYSGGTHTVTSGAGSAETWDSGFISSGEGVTYSRTFTVIGTNPYVCTPHSGNMFGTITVVEEGTLSTPSFEEQLDFSISPNPVTSQLNVVIPNTTTETSIKVFDILGKQIYNTVSTNTQTTSINVSSWNSGIYLIKLFNNDGSIVKRFIKQ